MGLIGLHEAMNDAAANTLLKQFVEPTGDTIFLFDSEDSSKIIKTILSRVQTTTIPPIAPKDIFNSLCISHEGKECELLQRASQACGGDITVAYRILSHGLMFPKSGLRRLRHLCVTGIRINICLFWIWLIILPIFQEKI